MVNMTERRSSCDRKIRVFGHNWHWGHDYELLKLPFVEWYWLKNHYRRWRPQHYFLRGIEEPPNVTWVDAYEPGKYDVALLHIDQQMAQPEIKKCNLYRELNQVIQDIPKIVLNHGTPMLDAEGFTPETVIHGGTVKVKGKLYTIPGIRKELQGNWHLCNTAQARDAWGWGDYILHGIDPAEWWVLPKEPRVFIAQSEAGMSDNYYGRRLLEAVRTELRVTYGIELIHSPVNYSSERDDTYPNYFDAYRNP
jgi:hypothetical protein